MNNDEARFILQAYRPSGKDAKDPKFAEALKQAEIDPDVRSWFADNRALDEVLSTQLRDVPVPPDLKASILAGRKVVAMPRRPRTIRWLAWAAGVVLLATVGTLVVRQSARPSWPQLVADVPTLLQSFDRLPKQTSDLNEVRTWLTSHKGHDDFSPPGGLSRQPSLGCHVLDWHGSKVTLVCFRVGTDAKQVAHLFVMDRDELRSAPGPLRQITEQAQWSTAAWSDDTHAYILATESTQPLTAQDILTSSG